MEMVWLDPGELFIGGGAEVHTVLGSCVSVVFYHPRSRFGAICHGKRDSRACAHPLTGVKICREMGDYVSCVLPYLLASFEQRGIARQELEVKLFGGGMMFGGSGAVLDAPGFTIGKRNVDTALSFIRAHHLHLTASDVGGPWARQLIFSTATGEIRLRRIRSSEQELATLDSGAGAGNGRKFF
ncbi:chemotaxis protein CheD [Candidatus Magnetaquicoccus inordinatus]|uniref:chemotaxis protein CheD n=1 Tax=Candidatus Magnetaquicoccus inordinatus TaxID=2496818 RepID=UPI00102C0765|nr:chemotaxis protein CheD [Candidatus Magnetaquicoccus inordinatus]